MTKRKRIFQSIIVFIISGILLTLVVSAVLYQYVKQERNQYQYVASNQSNIIKDSVDSALSRVYTMNALLVSYNGDTEFFDRVADIIYEEVRNSTGISLKNIAVAPKGIVSNVYPYKGNENLIGFNFMDESKPGNEEAIEAYLKGDIVITNPFKLVQGGFGMAGRLPIFLKNQDGKEKFWGLVTVTIDFNDLIHVIDMESLSRMNTNYSLWYRDDKGEKVQLCGRGDLSKTPVTYDFQMKNLTWYLDVSPSKGWISVEMGVVIGVTLIIFSIMLAMLYYSNANVREANLKLQSLANIDPLTSCYSRNYLNTVLINLQNGSWKNPNSKHSLIIVDIDSFKNVNDTYGHGVGDLAIKRVAEVLLNNIKEEDGDCVIRFGGDEFIILYNDVTKERFIWKLDKILQDVQNIKFSNYKNLKLSVSMGAEYHNDIEPLTYYEQVKKADEKLYESKKLGKNRYTI